MSRTDVIVLGAGIVGVSVALHLVKRGLGVILVDRGEPGRGTSYGNAGVIEGNTLFPVAFPSSLRALVRIALKRAPEANYHVGFLATAAPWLLAFRRNSSPERLIETMRAMRPLFARAIAEHEALIAESGAARYLRHTGWLKLYRTEESFAATARERALAAEFDMPLRALDSDAARLLEPSLAPVFARALLWERAASVTDPLALTRAYVARLVALGGAIAIGDAMTLRRRERAWQVETADGLIEADAAVVALGPWASDLLAPLGIRLPLGVKRGYHRHFRGRGNASLARPVVDVDYGYCLAPMDQGIRVTTGTEIAARDAPATPVQFDRVLPAAMSVFPLGEPVEDRPWMGARPCFPDSRPVIGRAPGQQDLWLAIGHGHSGLTLGPATGRLIAEMMTGAPTFCDPAPYGARRFTMQ